MGIRLKLSMKQYIKKLNTIQLFNSINRRRHVEMQSSKTLERHFFSLYADLMFAY